MSESPLLPSSRRRAPSFALASLAAITLLAAPPALAEEYTAARKCLRGLAGVLGGPIEIPGNVYQESRETNIGLGLTVGFAKGLGMSVTRTLVGVYELVTAPFEAPAGFAPIVAPEYPWEYFSEASRHSASSRGDYYGRQVADLERVNGVKVYRSGNTLTVSGGDSLLFATGSAVLKPGADAQLRSLAQALRQYPNSNVLVAGHTDSTGEELYNTALSDQRASAVRSRLIAHGVPTERIATRGYAAARPVASNDSVAGRRENRRAGLELRPSVAAGSPSRSAGSTTSQLGMMTSSGQMNSGWR